MQHQQNRPPLMAIENLEQIQQHHEEQEREYLREHLIEQIPELQEHPKVKEQWPELSRDELIAMNLEELKEIRTAYRLTIEDQI